MERDGDRAFPRVLGLLYDSNAGTGNLAYVYASTDKEIDVQRVGTFGVAPGRHHEQGARNVTDAARAYVPWGALRVHEGIGIAKVLARHVDRAEESVVHGLLVEVGVLRVVIGEVHF